jgi:4-amino-4-deoxy-L-arabinose transferase-like glycosyltransferase
LAAALFVISAWLLSYRIYAVHELGDEGYFVNAAMRILSGEIIYRDFQHNYPPGRMYVLALLIKLFGQDLSVVRAFWVACHSASVAVGFCVARRMMSLPLALCVGVVIIANSVSQNKAVELLVAALILLLLARSWEGKHSDFAAGVWLGCLTYFRHDVAVMGCMVFFLQTLLQAYLDPRDARYSIRLRA